MCFPEINVFWRPVLGRVDTNNDTADQCHHGKIKPVRQLQRKPFGRTHNSLKENSHIQQTPSCYLDVKQSRVYMNFDTMFYFNLYFHCFYTLHIRQQFTKYLSFYFLLLQVWSLRTLRPPSPCRVPSWGSSSSSLGLAPSWAPVCWQSFP